MPCDCSTLAVPDTYADTLNSVIGCPADTITGLKSGIETALNNCVSTLTKNPCNKAKNTFNSYLREDLLNLYSKNFDSVIAKEFLPLLSEVKAGEGLSLSADYSVEDQALSKDNPKLFEIVKNKMNILMDLCKVNEVSDKTGYSKSLININKDLKTAFDNLNANLVKEHSTSMVSVISTTVLAEHMAEHKAIEDCFPKIAEDYSTVILECLDSLKVSLTKPYIFQAEAEKDLKVLFDKEDTCANLKAFNLNEKLSADFTENVKDAPSSISAIESLTSMVSELENLKNELIKKDIRYYDSSMSMIIIAANDLMKNAADLKNEISNLKEEDYSAASFKVDKICPVSKDILDLDDAESSSVPLTNIMNAGKRYDTLVNGEANKKCIKIDTNGKPLSIVDSNPHKDEATALINTLKEFYPVNEQHESDLLKVGRDLSAYDKDVIFKATELLHYDESVADICSSATTYIPSNSLKTIMSLKDFLSNADLKDDISKVYDYNLGTSSKPSVKATVSLFTDRVSKALQTFDDLHVKTCDGCVTVDQAKTDDVKIRSNAESKLKIVIDACDGTTDSFVDPSLLLNVFTLDSTLANKLVILHNYELLAKEILDSTAAKDIFDLSDVANSGIKIKNDLKLISSELSSMKKYISDNMLVSTDNLNKIDGDIKNADAEDVNLRNAINDQYQAFLKRTETDTKSDLDKILNLISEKVKSFTSTSVTYRLKSVVDSLHKVSDFMPGLIQFQASKSPTVFVNFKDMADSILNECKSLLDQYAVDSNAVIQVAEHNKAEASQLSTLLNQWLDGSVADKDTPLDKYVKDHFQAYPNELVKARESFFDTAFTQNTALSVDLIANGVDVFNYLYNVADSIGFKLPNDRAAFIDAWNQLQTKHNYADLRTKSALDVTSTTADFFTNINNAGFVDDYIHYSIVVKATQVCQQSDFLMPEDSTSNLIKTVLENAGTQTAYLDFTSNRVDFVFYYGYLRDSVPVFVQNLYERLLHTFAVRSISLFFDNQYSHATLSDVKDADAISFGNLLLKSKFKTATEAANLFGKNDAKYSTLGDYQFNDKHIAAYLTALLEEEKARLEVLNNVKTCVGEKADSLTLDDVKSCHTNVDDVARKYLMRHVYSLSIGSQILGKLFDFDLNNVVTAIGNIASFDDYTKDVKQVEFDNTNNKVFTEVDLNSLKTEHLNKIVDASTASIADLKKRLGMPADGKSDPDNNISAEKSDDESMSAMAIFFIVFISLVAVGVIAGSIWYWQTNKKRPLVSGMDSALLELK